MKDNHFYNELLLLLEDEGLAKRAFEVCKKYGRYHAGLAFDEGKYYHQECINPSSGGGRVNNKKEYLNKTFK